MSSYIGFSLSKNLLGIPVKKSQTTWRRVRTVTPQLGTIGISQSKPSPLLNESWTKDWWVSLTHCSQNRTRTCIYTLLVLAVSDRLGINTFPAPPALNHWATWLCSGASSISELSTSVTLSYDKRLDRAPCSQDRNRTCSRPYDRVRIPTHHLTNTNIVNLI